MNSLEKAGFGASQQASSGEGGRVTTDAGSATDSDEKKEALISLMRGLWPFRSTNFHVLRDGDDINTSASGQAQPAPQVLAQNPFQLLSAASLRRYKKFFNLPHRSSTNTKQQLLEGVSEHFHNLEVPAYETIASFLYTAKFNKNKIDYPTAE
ncbi:unnamed protein product [Gongylonema pulchrum]|uniref:SAP30_Sin3_bdg domain-containing protein n=1 Tax=Gongylonema pulchrum TaxID=637853 RepID=A0A183D3A1_9BILA|nr:unnamed protein product [Gongylonema pulchrum]